jgi:hypothetical protein
MLPKDYDRKCSVEEKLLVVSLKGPVAKVVNRQSYSNSNSECSSVVEYSLDSNNVSTEAEEYTLLRTVTGKRLLKTG